MCKIQIFQCYFDNNNTKQMVMKNSQKMIKNSQKIIKTAKKQQHKEMPLTGLSESETIDKSQTASKKINARLLLIFVSYIVYHHIRKKIKSKKSARSNYV